MDITKDSIKCVAVGWLAGPLKKLEKVEECKIQLTVDNLPCTISYVDATVIDEYNYKLWEEVIYPGTDIHLVCCNPHYLITLTQISSNVHHIGEHGGSKLTPRLMVGLTEDSRDYQQFARSHTGYFIDRRPIDKDAQDLISKELQHIQAIKYLQAANLSSKAIESVLEEAVRQVRINRTKTSTCTLL
ncbi:hypothetical protein SAMD00019534_059100 [Acytostelium subglobosum LB1]|uniref:hypothetical protein n=1 Tax=Acytostelium subglobosum LB1 TaxID=1410327 RepID=UPI000644B395|nr:hypothetical protein SAMD00019534_059100 [Acytostelium subglobosum LB1]GAM22735.1 hypothetical protein SAMD00019534_059100 [Acytostelium subglobosum LB1]|eukprot:XP_012753962.1 hypothetical protein SAMD00019534_059100 [Acytostelium subglobosum LB1]